MAKKSSTTNPYIPQQQDLIFINFDPSLGQEITKRRPAVVISNLGYSKLTGLVVVAPITHAHNNILQKQGYFIPINNNQINGFINPLQFATFDYKKRHCEYIGLLDTKTFFELKNTILEIIT
ncbi:type II toxin-antitoxin system PemK/MazF family toxin [Companilactobacillus jidongensis]|uniref:type II toxin-antitoxin system PemK/MazF family toxin n=1 Tax=Companilactobacillus jidongensis TaxID=2486006 RepID=UPI000F7A97E2|nr:type II toxin-antitoxin system PemK/MazF family toxin [Companilactobacillus jidongensis]